MTRRKTIVDKVASLISTIKVNKGINKTDLINMFYDVDDYFTRRTLDVHICKAKKKFPEKSFKSINGVLTRIS